MGITQIERGLVFARIERKIPVLRSALQSNQGYLRIFCSGRYRGGGGLHSKIVSITKAADVRR